MANARKTRRVTLTFLWALLVAVIGLAVFSLTLSLENGRRDRDMQSLLSSIQSEVYDLMILSRDAALGDDEAIAMLPTIRASVRSKASEFNQLAQELESPRTQRFNQQIQSISQQVEGISSQADNVQFLRAQLTTLEERIPEIQQAYTQVVDTMLRTNAPADQVAEAQAQVWRAERALASLRQILGGDADPLAAAEQFRNDVLLFSEVLVGMREGSQALGITQVQSAEARELLEQIFTQFQDVNTSVQSLIDASPALASTTQAADGVLRTGADVLNTTQALAQEIAALPDDLNKRPFSTAMVILASIIAAVLAFLIGWLNHRQTRENLLHQERANERNQEAILRLLDEIADLAEGDLTVRATVTEDFTGAIADSINYAIEQLRELVARIVETAESVASASNETRATAMRLSEASEHQATQINQTTQVFGDVANNLTRMADDAEELGSDAQNSVEVARNGNQVVQNTISGMNNIREQIQDTSKRIKRLGESSQEIGDIVSLINEIADQTNILALNASIQAAMAGEAGRGFAVVADEVQSLAERAASSTKQIEGLVHAIQSDTNEAVSSMEQTTSEVVRGAELANSAGDALTEIQSTSENLARLILMISQSAREQSDQANKASRSMRVISSITEQTLADSTDTGRAIGQLAEEALQLRASVADFKLPKPPEFDQPDTGRDGTEDAEADEYDELGEASDAPTLGHRAEDINSELQDFQFDDELDETDDAGSTDDPSGLEPDPDLSEPTWPEASENTSEPQTEPEETHGDSDAEVAYPDEPPESGETNPYADEDDVVEEIYGSDASLTTGNPFAEEDEDDEDEDEFALDDDILSFDIDLDEDDDKSNR